MRRALLLLIALAGLAGPAAPRSGEGSALIARPVTLDPADPARRTVGALEFLGGWALSSADPCFGGLSAMVPDGNGLLALSDRGVLVRIEPRAAGGPRGTVVGPLPAGPGDGSRTGDRDSESLVRDATGRLWIGFEDANAIWRYAGQPLRGDASIRPAAMRDWPQNGGPEAMLRLPDGRFLVWSEQAEGAAPDTRQGLIFAGDPTDPALPPPQSFAWRSPAGHVPTDAALLPDGRILVLHRRFTLADGVSMALVVVDAAAIRPGATAEGEPVARLAPPLTVDNMEAIAVMREGARIVLWIASDDNFSPMQRTLLLKFELRLPGR